jgi:cation diffusion facilitator family transporter
VELVGGYYAHSLAVMSGARRGCSASAPSPHRTRERTPPPPPRLLLTRRGAARADAAHLLSDLGTFCVSLLTLTLATRRADAAHSFGYHRAELLGALFSVASLWLVTGMLLAAAVRRLQAPQPVSGQAMFWLALAGIAVNVTLAAVLHGAQGHGHSHGGLSGGAHTCGGGGGGSGHGHSHGGGRGCGGDEGDVEQGGEGARSSGCDGGGGSHGHSHAGGGCGGGGMRLSASSSAAGAPAGDAGAKPADAPQMFFTRGRGLPLPPPSAPPEESAGAAMATIPPALAAAAAARSSSTSGAVAVACGAPARASSSAAAGAAPPPPSRDDTMSPSGSFASFASFGFAGAESGGSGDAAVDVNMRGAYLHVLADLLQSIGVAFAGALIWWNPALRWVDPACTFLFSAAVLATTAALLRDISDVIMERTPRGVNAQAVAAGLLGLPGVLSVHDLHVWAVRSLATDIARVLVRGETLTCAIHSAVTAHAGQAHPDGAPGVRCGRRPRARAARRAAPRAPRAGHRALHGASGARVTQPA